MFMSNLIIIPEFSIKIQDMLRLYEQYRKKAIVII
jgi:hypothetical protein